MTGLFAVLGTVLTAAPVYRICKKCWRSTEHSVSEASGDGMITYKCLECGHSYTKEKESEEA